MDEVTIKRGSRSEHTTLATNASFLQREHFPAPCQSSTWLPLAYLGEGFPLCSMLTREGTNTKDLEGFSLATYPIPVVVRFESRKAASHISVLGIVYCSASLGATPIYFNPQT